MFNFLLSVLRSFTLAISPLKTRYKWSDRFVHLSGLTAVTLIEISLRLSAFAVQNTHRQGFDKKFNRTILIYDFAPMELDVGCYFFLLRCCPYGA